MFRRLRRAIGLNIVRVLPVLNILSFIIMILSGFMTLPLLASIALNDGANSQVMIRRAQPFDFLEVNPAMITIVIR